jgi:hypothetical protein
MIYSKREGRTFDTPFLNAKKVSEVLDVGDKILIMAEAIPMGQYGKFYHKIETSDSKTYLFSFNASSLRNLQGAYGDDDHKWIGKFAVYQGIKEIKGMQGNIFTAEE